jgi:hypothetical protein
MAKYVIGIDPDSKAHGVAIYNNGKLIELLSMPLVEIVNMIDKTTIYKSAHWHIENVCAMGAVFQQRQTKNKNVNSSMAKRIGMCQQAQTELERFLDFYGVEFTRHKISKTWKKDKKQFELVTGWTGRSNEDTRSAAYFGWLGLK